MEQIKIPFLEFPLFIDFDIDGHNTGVIFFISNDNGIFIDSANPVRIGIKTTSTAKEWMKNGYSKLIDKDKLFKNPKIDKYPIRRE